MSLTYWTDSLVLFLVYLQTLNSREEPAEVNRNKSAVTESSTN